MERFDVCVVGSANLDVVATADRHPKPGETVLGADYHEYPGGKGLNQAVAARRSGGDVAFIGALGNDSAAGVLRTVLADDGIDTTGVASIPGPSGRAVIVVDADGENSIVVIPGANAAVTTIDALPATSVMLCQLEISLDTVATSLRLARRQGSITVLNPAPAHRLEREIVALCDVIVPNEHEVGLLGGAGALLDSGCGAVVVTLGERGVDIHTAEGVVHMRAFPVDVVDTTGAGDAFCGALASRLAAGDDLVVAARWAAAAGALATTVAGAVPAQPYGDAISALLASERHR